MKVTMLGSGTSVGVPCLGRAGWGRCNPENPKNRRQRCALLVQKGDFNLLVDAGPDIRNQLLAAGNPKIHAVLTPIPMQTISRGWMTSEHFTGLMK